MKENDRPVTVVNSARDVTFLSKSAANSVVQSQSSANRVLAHYPKHWPTPAERKRNIFIDWAHAGSFLLSFLTFSAKYQKDKVQSKTLGIVASREIFSFAIPLTPLRFYMQISSKEQCKSDETETQQLSVAKQNASLGFAHKNSDKFTKEFCQLLSAESQDFQPMAFQKNQNIFPSSKNIKS